jgi:hypothetical protein
MRSAIYIERLRVKGDLVNWLGCQAGYRSYLEIATPFTRFQFSLIAPDILTEINRVVYYAPPDFDDGLPVTAWDHRPTVQNVSVSLWINRRGST